MSSPTPAVFRHFFYFQIVCGIAVLAAGIAALTGWHTGLSSFLSVAPNLPKLHYLEGICFVISGLCIFLSLIKRERILNLFAFILCLIAVFDLTETTIGLPFDASVFWGINDAGRDLFHNSLITATAFLFIGLAWLIMFSRRRYRRLVSGAMGAFAVGAGIAAFVGFIAGHADLVRSSNWSDISLLSAVGFLAAGITIILKNRRSKHEIAVSWVHYVPVATLIVGITLSFVVRQKMHINEFAVMDQTIGSELQNLKRTIETEIGRRTLANERMAERWTDHGPMDQKMWEKEAHRYFRDFGSYQAMEWVDTEYKIQWVVPLENNGNSVGKDLRTVRNARMALDRARLTKTTSVSRTVELSQGGLGILACTPIYDGESFYGFVLGVFRIDQLVEGSIPKTLSDGYSITFSDSGRQVYSSSTNIPDSGISQSVSLEFKGTLFSIGLQPNRAKLVALSSANKDIALFLFTLVSLLLSGAVYLAQRARRHTEITNEANRRLKSEIEERKNVEQMLGETSTFREAILNGANYIIISTDRAGKITSFNRTAECLLGYRAEETIDKLSLDHFHDSEELIAYSKELSRKFGYKVEPGFEALVARARDLIADEQTWKYYRNDGSMFPVALSVTAIVDEDRKITGYLGIGRDDSQLHLASRKLAESEERFKALVNHVPAITYIKDSEGRYKFVNSKYEALFGFEPGSLVGKTDFDLIDRKTAKANFERQKRVLETGIPEETIELVKHGDGPETYYLFIRFVVPTTVGENSLGVVAIDLTAQKSIEEELREANKAAVEASRMKSEFLANMSHEIRTPMNGVLGMLEVLLDTNLNPSQREYAGVIQDSAKSLLTILDDILDFSKLEAGKLSIETIEFDLRATIENTVALFAEQAESKGIEVTSLIKPEVKVGLLGDPGRVRQVLTNLIGNAVKFTTEGSVTVAVSLLKETEKGVVLKFDVIDTGIGISKEAQQILFRAFVQADGSMVRKYGGTGLGLSISKQLIELMNGEISVESEPGAGSVFSFTAAFGLANSCITDVPAVDLSGVRVLVVDDLASNRESYCSQLRGLGIVATEAVSGSDCISRLLEQSDSREPIDIVLLDLEMPEMNGFDTASIIKSNPGISDTKIVLMAAQGRRGHAREAAKQGISAYLVKPIRQVELFDCIAALHSGESATDSSGIDVSKTGDSLITRYSILDKRSESGPPVLIVAGQKKNRSVTSMQLELLGYRSEFVTDGFEAISALKQRAYSLILMEIDLPGMDGIATAAKIRKHFVDMNVPIVALSSNPDEKEMKKALKSGMNEYMAFPLSEDKLMTTVGEFVSGSFRMTPDAVIEQVETGLPEPEMEKFLNDLNNDIGPEMVAMTVSLFTEDTDRQLLQIDSELNRRGFLRIQELAELLAETCEDISALRLSKLAHSLKTAAASEDIDETRLVYEGIRSLFGESIKQLESRQAAEMFS